MRLHSDICVLFTPSEPGWPGTDAPMRDELNQVGGGCVLRGQDRLERRVSTRMSSHPRGVDEVGGPEQGEVLEYYQALEIGINRGQLCPGQAAQVL